MGRRDLRAHRVQLDHFQIDAVAAVVLLRTRAGQHVRVRRRGHGDDDDEGEQKGATHGGRGTSGTQCVLGESAFSSKLWVAVGRQRNSGTAWDAAAEGDGPIANFEHVAGVPIAESRNPESESYCTVPAVLNPHFFLERPQSPCAWPM